MEKLKISSGSFLVLLSTFLVVASLIYVVLNQKAVPLHDIKGKFLNFPKSPRGSLSSFSGIGGFNCGTATSQVMCGQGQFVGCYWVSKEECLGASSITGASCNSFDAFHCGVGDGTGCVWSTGYCTPGSN